MEDQKWEGAQRYATRDKIRGPVRSDLFMRVSAAFVVLFKGIEDRKSDHHSRCGLGPGHVTFPVQNRPVPEWGRRSFNPHSDS